MSRIFWDTNLFVYLFESYGEHSSKVRKLRERMIERKDELFTSTLTIGELLVKPESLGLTLACSEYEDAIRSTAMVLDFDLAAARNYAKLRAGQIRKVQPPDAIQLACAATAGIDLFLTNDKRLHDIRVEGIHFVSSIDRAPL